MAYDDSVALDITEEEFLAAAAAADDAGIRIETVGDLPVWEFMSSLSHGEDVQAIFAAIQGPEHDGGGCECFPYADIYIRFAEGSLRRPDISVFCERPPRTNRATTTIPTLVVEVVSGSSIVKDLQISPPFYLSPGVKDVYVYDPASLTVTHFRTDGRSLHRLPVVLTSESGCRLAFPLPRE